MIYDAVIVGGGFYGAAIAVYLVRQRGLRHVLVIEREREILARASYNNQARVHNGYHYPRSFTTAYRSRVNLPRFVRDWQGAVKQDFVKLYAIARRGSQVTARQFERFCRAIGATTRRADPALRALFEPRLIEEVFVVEEYAFDAGKLAAWASRELAQCGVSTRLDTRAVGVRGGPDGSLRVALQPRLGPEESVACRYVFNCAYSGLGQLSGVAQGARNALKHEITEMALLEAPPALRELGVTVMDGPFFSVMPFPARALHTLSHVRYTPHLHWIDRAGVDPYGKLAAYQRATRVDRMMRDAVRYLPALGRARYVESLFEVKTVLVKNEGDDGRPILFERHPHLPGCYSVLGGKIDNIYDVLEKLDSERIAPSAGEQRSEMGAVDG